MTAEVLVTDGEERAALAVVRSLGRTGARVTVVSRRGPSLAGASRFCHRALRAPDPLTSPGDFAGFVAGIVRDLGIQVVLPIAEPSLLALLGERERLRPAVIPFPPLEVFRRLSDKAALLEAAPRFGISVPQQVQVDSREELCARKPGLRFPLVAKPARTVGESLGVRARLGVSHLADAAALDALVAVLPAQAFPLLLQQRIVGPGVGVFLLPWEGLPYAVFSHRRLREKPPAGGVSVYRESIAADPELTRRSLDLLAAFQWEGVAMVEYKVDAETGTPYLMEINGRFWGSLQLAVDAGVDFPRLLLELASGKRPVPVTHYTLGVRSRWWWGDMDHLLSRLRRSNEELAMPPGSPTKAKAVREFFRLWRPGDRNEILRLSDPMPFVRETADWFARR